MTSRGVRESLAILKKTYPDARYYLNFSTPLQLLVATILSAQVRDERVNAATPPLFTRYRSVEDFARADLQELIGMLPGISFPANKARHIREACRILSDRHGGEVPRSLDDLVTLPGIGRKTANAILINGFGIVEGIVVDTHVIRISYRLGWTRSSDPEEIERDLMAIIPKPDWARITWLLKSHGRAVCTGPVPFCSRCPLEAICPKRGVTKRK